MIQLYGIDEDALVLPVNETAIGKYEVWVKYNDLVKEGIHIPIKDEVFIRHNKTSMTLWNLRSKCAASGPGVISVTIEELNAIDKECTN